MGFWHIVMGIYGGGTAVVTPTVGTYTELIGDQDRYTKLASDTNDS